VTLSFQYPWLLLLFGLLPLLFLSRRTLPAVPFSDVRLLELPERNSWRTRARRLLPLLRVLWIGLLILAAAQPRITERTPTTPTEQRSILFIVDTSGSMSTIETTGAKGPVTRLDQAKVLASQWSNSLASPNARDAKSMGIIALSAVPEVVCPLTENLPIFRELLAGLTVDLLSNQTNIGDAIGLAVTRLLETAAGERYILLLTDGAHNVPSGLSSLEAARIAEAMSIPIYTVSIGSPETSLDPEEFKNDRLYLERIAKITGGVYAEMENAVELPRVARKIVTAIESTKMATERIWKSIAPHVLVAAAALWLLEVTLRRTFLWVMPE
jgi:Ca-activated chloride channel family protein